MVRSVLLFFVGGLLHDLLDDRQQLRQGVGVVCVYICIHVSCYTVICMYIYIYICIYNREREREREKLMHTNGRTGRSDG